MMLFGKRRDFLAYLDIGLFGTFVRIDDEGNEQGYVNLWYIPINAFSKKAVKYPRPIKKEYVHFLNPTESGPGIEEKVVLIYTGETGSLVSDVVGVRLQNTIKELRSRVSDLQMQLSAAKQTVKDATSSAEQAVSRARAITGSRRESSPFGPPGFRDEDYEF